MKMRAAASVGVTALVVGALSGCMFLTPQQTARSYTPGDGVNGAVGGVSIRNAMLLTEQAPAASKAANMLGVLTNSSDTAKTVTLQYATSAGTETTTLTVPANGLLSIRPNPASQVDASVPTQAKAVQLQDVKAVPGALFTVGFSVGSDAPVTLRLPVLTGSVDQYASLLPTPGATPTRTTAPGTINEPEVTETPSSTPTEESSPSATD